MSESKISSSESSTEILELPIKKKAGRPKGTRIEVRKRIRELKGLPEKEEKRVGRPRKIKPVEPEPPKKIEIYEYTPENLDRNFNPDKFFIYKVKNKQELTRADMDMCLEYHFRILYPRQKRIEIKFPDTWSLEDKRYWMNRKLAHEINKFAIRAVSIYDMFENFKVRFQEKDCKLTNTEMGILKIVYKYENKPIKTWLLAKMLQVDYRYLHFNLNRLIKYGLMKKIQDEKNKRVKYFLLTREGKRISRIVNKFEEYCNKFLEKIYYPDDDAIPILHEVVKKMHENIFGKQILKLGEHYEGWLTK